MTEIVVLEHQKWYFRASRFKNFLGASERRFHGLRQYLLKKFYPDLKLSGEWTVCSKYLYYNQQNQ